MELTRHFNNLSKSDVAIAGGKGASLGEMTQAGIPVPEGFVLLSSAFERFIEETHLDVEIDSILHKVKHDDINTVENASEQIKVLILNSETPKDITEEVVKNFKKLGAKYVAVRSSATSEDSASAAWAGQLDSYLNTTKADLLENVKKCWASLFTPRAIFYRFEKDLHKQKISVAVVVQKMVESEVSGIAFSVHPVTQDYNQLIIEGAYGLGEAIVSGQITPDSYVVEKEPRRIIDKNITKQEKGLYKIKGGGNEWREVKNGERQKLNDKEILELSELILRIEKHYDFPCDIEWAREKGKFYIVQSRPITTLTSQIEEKEENNFKLFDTTRNLKKTFSREHSLFYAYVWQDGNIKVMDKWTDENIKNVLFLRESRTNKISVWYEQAELDKFYKIVSKKINTEKDYFDNALDSYYKYWKILLPYVKGEKEIKDIKELETFYNVWVKWWAPMAVIFVAVDLTDVSKDIKKKALKARADTQKYSDEGDNVFINFFTKNFPEYKDLTFVVSPQEVFALKNRRISKEEIINLKERLKGFGLFNDQLFLASELNKKLEEYGLKLEEETSNEKIKEIKGTIASPGKVKGKVRLILYKKDIKNLQEGEILVTEMTSPEFVPAMKKASAIVTDEGGLTSHAAIVSRELRKPCIIGTKIATKILKDGDLVEVDANNGIVRILEKKVAKKEENTSLGKKFLKELGNEKIMLFESNFIPLIILIDWFNYYDQNGVKLNIYPVILYKNGLLIKGIAGLDRYQESSRITFEGYLDKKMKISEINKKYNDIKSAISKEYEMYFLKKKTSEKLIFQDLVRIYHLLHELVARTLFLDTLDKNLINNVLTQRKINVNWEKAEEVYHIMDFLSFDLRNNEEILRTLKQSLSIMALQHTYTNYTYIPSKEEIKKEIKKIDTKKLSFEIQKKRLELEDNKLKKKKLRDKLSEKEKEVVDFLDWGNFLRDDRKTLINKCDALILNLAQELYSFWGVNKKLARHSFMFEIIKGKEYVINRINKIKKREDKYVCLYYGDNSWEESYENIQEDLELISRRLLEENKEKHQEKVLRGEAASRGIARGKVRIVINKQSFSTFKEGDILVAPMTRPEFVPLMKIASGVITDEGGITSHAAIVSRELGIPCVIGTKIATHVLKDGDLVEVDAEKGKVKILKRESKGATLSKENINLEEWEFEFQQRNTQPILMADFWCRALYKKYVKEINLPVEPYDYFFTTSSKGYVKTAQKKITLEAIKKALDSNNTYSEYLYDKTIERVNELDAVAKRILLEIKAEVSNKILVQLWKEFDESLLTLIPWYWIPYYPVEQNLLSDKVKEGLIKYKNKIEKITDFNNAFLISMSPTKEMAFKEEQKDFFDLVKIVIKKNNFSADKIFNEKAKEYLKKYSWMNTFILLPTEPLSLNELIGKIKKAVDEKSIETYYLQEKKKTENDKISKKILQIIGKDKELLAAIENIKKIGWVLTWSVETSLHTLADLQPFFKLIAKGLGISYSHWIHLTSDEIVQVLEGKKNLEELQLKEREKGYFFLMENGIQKMAIGEEGKSLSEWVEKNLNKVDENITELKGQSACSGYAKGSVRTALIAKDSYNLKEGEILVCAMTSPDYVPAMKRASAIITDEGGMLCHAAIMSREFGKPCIIATKIATRVLKDGDIVEVDADKGIVKILEKKK